MYTLHDLYGRNADGWHVLENGEARILSELASAYDRLHMFVSWPGRDVHAVDLSAQWATIPSYLWTDTVEQYLSTIITPILPEIEAVRIGESPCMRYSDLFDYPVSITTGNRNYSAGSNIPIGEDNDILIVGENGIVDELADSCLFTVNGSILPHIQVNDALYIMNGRRALSQAVDGIQTFGAINLSGLGDWGYYPLDTLDIRAIPQTLRERAQAQVRVRVTVPFSLAGTHVLPIVDGNPIWIWDMVEVLDDRNVLLTLNALRIAENILRTPIAQRVGPTAMNLRGTGVALDRLELENYLRLTPSALVVIHNDDVNRLVEPMGRTDIPGRFSFHYPPQGVMIMEDGRMADYNIDGWDGDQASIGIADGLKFDYLHNHANPEESLSAAQSGRHPTNPTALKAYMLNLYTSKPKA